MPTTRLTPEIELDGLSPDEAFAALGNETRLEIIRVLWQAGALQEYDDVDETTETTIGFSDLRRRVDLRDNGRFNYHLSKLVPHFVRQTDDGYRLSGAGKKIARTVVAISGEPAPDLTATPDTDCPICGSAITATYEDQWLRFTCTECDGLFGDAAPEGAILHSSFPAAGLTDRTSEGALSTGLYRCMLDLTYLNRGVCRECASSISTSMSICDDHSVTGAKACDTCGMPFSVLVEYRCETCRFAKHLPVEICVMGLTPVIGFLYHQDVDVLAPSLDEIVDVFQTQVETVVSEEPRRVTVTVQDGDDALTVTLDEEMTVLDVSH